MSALPTVQQERWMTAASRLGISAKNPWLAARVARWTSATIIARCAFFVLGAVAAGLVGALLEITYRPAATFLTGVVLIAAAEWLILQKRLFHTGVEEALWVGGVLALAMSLHLQAPLGSSLIIALALAIAAVRLLSPLMSALAVVAVSVAISFLGARGSIPGAGLHVAASVFCFAVGVVGLWLAQFQVHRPSQEQMLNWLIAVMPLSGFLWLAVDSGAGPRLFAFLACVGYGTVALIVGARRRVHAPLIAFLVCVGCVAYQLRNLTALPLKLKLIVWGSAALMLALALNRYFRLPRRGVTSAQLSERGKGLDLLQLASVASLGPTAQHAPVPFKGEGGRFSGGGADGGY